MMPTITAPATIRPANLFMESLLWRLPVGAWHSDRTEGLGVPPRTALRSGSRAALAGRRRFRFQREPLHAADEFRRDRRGPGGGRGDEHQDLLHAHAQLALMRGLEAQLAGAATDLDRPEVEREALAIVGGSGEVHGEMDRRGENLFVMKETGRAGCEAVLEPVLHKIADHLEVARIEDPAGRITVPEPDEHFTLKS